MDANNSSSVLSEESALSDDGSSNLLGQRSPPSSPPSPPSSPVSSSLAVSPGSLRVVDNYYRDHHAHVSASSPSLGSTSPMSRRVSALVSPLVSPPAVSPSSLRFVNGGYHNYSSDSIVHITSDDIEE